MKPNESKRSILALAIDRAELSELIDGSASWMREVDRACEELLKDHEGNPNVETKWIREAADRIKDQLIRAYLDRLGLF